MHKTTVESIDIYERHIIPLSQSTKRSQNKVMSMSLKTGYTRPDFYSFNSQSVDLIIDQGALTKLFPLLRKKPEISTN